MHDLFRGDPGEQLRLADYWADFEDRFWQTGDPVGVQQGLALPVGHRRMAGDGRAAELVAVEPAAAEAGAGDHRPVVIGVPAGRPPEA